MNILFVCTGNTCRSPMAEVILKDLLMEAGLDGIKVKSAGIAAYPGQKANPQANRIMEEQGIQLEGHRTSQVNAELLNQADLILTMTEGHKIAVQSGAPTVWNKIYTLKEYAGMLNKDIPDPFGRSDEEYRKTADEIRNALKKVIAKLKQI